jgi:hypothetical protein
MTPMHADKRWSQNCLEREVRVVEENLGKYSEGEGEAPAEPNKL